MNSESSGADPLAGRIPITLITGFLGSGKTTLLSQLVKHADMAGAVVVINEIGEIGIDHDLVAMATEKIALLANGCICCSVRSDLQETLRDLFARRQVGEIPDFDRVIVETTGLADPAPVVQTLVSDTLLAARYRLDGLVTLVDAVNGLEQLTLHEEPAKQIALADRLILTKTDLTTESQIEPLLVAIKAINPSAALSRVVQGHIEPSQLTGLGLASAKAGPKTLSFLGQVMGGDETVPERTLSRRNRPHYADIQTQSLRFEQPFTWPALSAALELLTSLRGPDLLRVKAIVNVEGEPVVVQGVQHIFHPPVTLDRWPSEDRSSRFVFITKSMNGEVIGNLLRAVAAMQTPTV